MLAAPRQNNAPLGVYTFLAVPQQLLPQNRPGRLLLGKVAISSDRNQAKFFLLLIYTVERRILCQASLEDFESLKQY
jgi:hypothetical protein